MTDEQRALRNRNYLEKKNALQAQYTERCRQDSLRNQRDIERQRQWDAYQKDMLAKLFASGMPASITVLQEGCRIIAAALEVEKTDRISWKELQQRWPSLTASYRQFFLAEHNDGWFSRDDFRDILDGALFTLSFSIWAGAQRIVDAPQIVFRVNAESLYTHLAYADPEAMKAVNEALLGNCNPLHPSDDWSVGWLRVHKDDENRLLFVDEVQSDALESLRACRGGLDKKAVARVERYLKRWHLHGFASVHRWAHDIGYRVGIHSHDSAARKSGMTQSERKWNTYYLPIIRQFGLREETVQAYPAPIMVGPEDSR